MDILRPVLNQIGKIWEKLDLMPVIRWGIITQADPLRVQLDGDVDPMVLTPMTIVASLRVGERVVCVEQHRRVIILGRGKGAGDFGVARGSVPVPGTGTLTVTFPAERFTVPPILNVTPVGGGIPVVGTPSETSFTLRIANSAGDQIAGTAHWSATQTTASSAGG